MRVAVVAEVVRSGFVECRHYGSWVALDPTGAVVAQGGEPEAPVLPRSSNKPIQALGMVRQGLDLEPELLALACASHSGEDFHVDGVRRILAGAGLAQDALLNPPDYPLDDAAREAVIRDNRPPTSITMNCSGKHAAMLATCVLNGWPTPTYRDPDHPLQQAIMDTFAETTGEPVRHVAVDGCGAPLLGTTLIGLARAFARIARAEPASDPGAARVADAIRRHPEYVSGTTRDELVLLRALPGAIGKAGAEACYAVALPDGRAVALKIDDGGQRARPVLMAALLDRLGWLEDPGTDAAAARRTGAAVLLGGGRPVGEIRAVC